MIPSARHPSTTEPETVFVDPFGGVRIRDLRFER